MTVLTVAYPLFPVSADAPGGAEQVVYLLDREFDRRGHQSLVIAAEGSSVHGQIFPAMRVEEEIDEDIRTTAQAVHGKAIRELLGRFQIDFIHLHGLDFHAYIPDTRVPMLATLHLPLDWYAAPLNGSRVRLNCVSRSQAQESGFPVVLNGVDTSRYLPALSKADYFLWLGRVCPEKGVHLALQAAKSADVTLLIAGPVHPFASHQHYFREEVTPLLDEKRRYLGAVKGVEKSRLLGEARAVLVTSTVAETSSLVAMEAASSGTPVIAVRAGALPEVVEHGITGFVADSSEQLPMYLHRIHELDPLKCRETALRRFSAERMAEDYLSLYSRILGTSCAPQDALYAS